MTIQKTGFPDTSLPLRHTGRFSRIVAAAGTVAVVRFAYCRAGTYGHAGFCNAIFRLALAIWRTGKDRQSLGVKGG